MDESTTVPTLFAGDSDTAMQTAPETKIETKIPIKPASIKIAVQKNTSNDTDPEILSPKPIAKKVKITTKRPSKENTQPSGQSLELQQLILYQREHTNSLQRLELKIFELETKYLREFSTNGNVLRSWEGFAEMKTSNVESVAKKAAVRVEDKDRFFSFSSTTAPTYPIASEDDISALNCSSVLDVDAVASDILKKQPGGSILSSGIGEMEKRKRKRKRKISMEA